MSFESIRLNYLIGDIDSDINHLINISNIESTKTNDWIKTCLRSLKQDFERLKKEIELQNES